MTSRKTPLERKAQILDSAIRLARVVGYTKVTRRAIASDTGLSVGMVNKYIGDKHELRKAIMRLAVFINDHNVVLQGVSSNDPIACGRAK